MNVAYICKCKFQLKQSNEIKYKIEIYHHGQVINVILLDIKMRICQKKKKNGNQYIKSFSLLSITKGPFSFLFITPLHKACC